MQKSIGGKFKSYLVKSVQTTAAGRVQKESRTVTATPRKLAASPLGTHLLDELIYRASQILEHRCLQFHLVQGLAFIRLNLKSELHNLLSSNAFSIGDSG